MPAIKSDLMSGAHDALDFGETFSNAVGVAAFGISEKPRLAEALSLSAITQSSPVQTRIAFDPVGDSADGEFLASIKNEGGNHEPIWVVSIGGNPEEYQLIAGHRRVDALRTAGLETARALVWPATTTSEQRDKLTFIENYHRKDLSTAETARAIQKLMDKYGYKLKVAAEFLSISVGHAHNLKAVAEGPKEVLALVEDGLIGASSAKALVGLDTDSLALAVEAIRQGKPVSETLEELEKGVLGKAKPKDINPRALARQNHSEVLSAGAADQLLPLLANGEESQLLEALNKTGVADAFAPEDLRLMALLRLGMGDASWDYAITTFSTLLRADRRSLKSILSTVERILNLKAFSEEDRWQRQVQILRELSNLLVNESESRYV